VGEISFWYRPTRVVPDQRPLNGRCCYGTMHSLSQIDIPVDLQRCLLGRHNNFQDMVNALFLCIIIALHVNADSFVPRAKPGSYRHWWDNALSDLKEHSID